MAEEKIIAPVSNTEEIRAAAAATAAAKPLAPQSAAPAVISSYDPASMHSAVTPSAAAAMTMMGHEQPKRLIGLYVISGLIGLGGFLIILGGGTAGMVLGFLQILLAAGLLLKNSFARKLFIVLTAINLVFSGYGLLAALGGLARTNGFSILITVVAMILQLTALVYLCLPRVKEQFS